MRTSIRTAVVAATTAVLVCLGALVQASFHVLPDDNQGTHQMATVAKYGFLSPNVLFRSNDDRCHANVMFDAENLLGGDTASTYYLMGEGGMAGFVVHQNAQGLQTLPGPTLHYQVVFHQQSGLLTWGGGTRLQNVIVAVTTADGYVLAVYSAPPNVTRVKLPALHGAPGHGNVMYLNLTGTSPHEPKALRMPEEVAGCPAYSDSLPQRARNS